MTVLKAGRSSRQPAVRDDLEVGWDVVQTHWLEAPIHLSAGKITCRAADVLANEPGPTHRHRPAMKTRRGFLPAGPFRWRHDCHQYIRGQQLLSQATQFI
jgi:hypothetical protein